MFQFYARPIAEPALDAMAAERAKGDAERRARCEVCARFLDGCAEPQSCRAFTACLARNQADLDDCRAR